MKVAEYCVAAFPKLDSEMQIQDLREQFSTWYFRVRPYIPVVLPFAPITFEEIQGASEHIGRVRRNLEPLAIVFSRCVEQGDSLFFALDDGRDELVKLHLALVGAEPLSLISDMPVYEPRVWLGRVTDARERAGAIHKANRIGRSCGLVDSLSLLRIEPDDEHKLVASFPFGIGRVDYYDRFTT
ncbi:hypothetical protein FJY70_03055 [candidate division WOR-3 bacterium]|nr:hypothetical protein [candidate division WOR-3 bacterium]